MMLNAELLHANPKASAIAISLTLSVTKCMPNPKPDPNSIHNFNLKRSDIQKNMKRTKKHQ